MSDTMNAALKKASDQFWSSPFLMIDGRQAFLQRNTSTELAFTLGFQAAWKARTPVTVDLSELRGIVMGKSVTDSAGEALILDVIATLKAQGVEVKL